MNKVSDLKPYKEVNLPYNGLGTIHDDYYRGIPTLIGLLPKRTIYCVILPKASVLGIF